MASDEGEQLRLHNLWAPRNFGFRYSGLKNLRVFPSHINRGVAGLLAWMNPQHKNIGANNTAAETVAQQVFPPPEDTRQLLRASCASGLAIGNTAVPHSEPQGIVKYDARLSRTLPESFRSAGATHQCGALQIFASSTRAAGFGRRTAATVLGCVFPTRCWPEQPPSARPTRNFYVSSPGLTPAFAVAVEDDPSLFASGRRMNRLWRSRLLSNTAGRWAWGARRSTNGGAAATQACKFRPWNGPAAS